MTSVVDRGPSRRAWYLGQESIVLSGCRLGCALGSSRSLKGRIKSTTFCSILWRRAYYYEFFFTNLHRQLLNWFIHPLTLLFIFFGDHSRSIVGLPLALTRILPPPLAAPVRSTLWWRCLRMIAPRGCWATLLPPAQQELPLPRPAQRSFHFIDLVKRAQDLDPQGKKPPSSLQRPVRK